MNCVTLHLVGYILEYVLRKFLCAYNIFGCEIEIHQIGNFGKQVIIHFNTQNSCVMLLCDGMLVMTTFCAAESDADLRSRAADISSFIASYFCVCYLTITTV